MFSLSLSFSLAIGLPSLVEDSADAHGVLGRVCAGSRVGRQTGRPSNHFIRAE